ncbi:MAG: hypothetical protein ABSH22_02380 [Tepidisphaeraceae bacterium]
MSEPTEIQHHDEPDTLQRALAEINRQADQQAVSDQTLANALAKMRQAADARVGFTRQIIIRFTDMTLTQKIAAALTLTLSGLAVWFAFSLFGGFATVTYSQVIDQIRTARTMTWNETVSGGQMPMPMTMKTLCNESRVRVEYSQGTTVMIMDQKAGMSLILNGLDKTAQLIEIKKTGASDAPPSPQDDPAAFFRNLATQQGKPIEDRQINGIEAKGFSTESFGFPTSLYVDPKTKMPLLVESTVTMGSQRMKVVMTDFAFDTPLDDSLFSLDPPPGYTLKDAKPMVVVPDLEPNVTTVLSDYAAASGGTFPPSLSDTADLSKIFAGHTKNGQLDDAGQKDVTSMGVVLASMMFLKEGTDYGYTPQGAKLGDADKMIFWYLNKDTKKYRAIYGDLHAADISAADLPLKK